MNIKQIRDTQMKEIEKFLNENGKITDKSLAIGLIIQKPHIFSILSDQLKTDPDVLIYFIPTTIWGNYRIYNEIRNDEFIEPMEVFCDTLTKPFDYSLSIGKDPSDLSINNICLKVKDDLLLPPDFIIICNLILKSLIIKSTCNILKKYHDGEIYFSFELKISRQYIREVVEKYLPLMEKKRLFRN